MDIDPIVLIALGPFYALAVWSCWLGVNYTMHKLQKMDYSATETQLTETAGPSTAPK